MAKRTSERRPRARRPSSPSRHKDTRTNIPTEELRDFVADDEKAPKTHALPARPVARSAAGLEGQGRAGPAPTWPCPSCRSTSRRRSTRRRSSSTCASTAKAGEQEPELTLFADFNGLDDFDKKVDFYHHDQHWSNRMILGDSLLVMTSLAEKEGLKGKVQMIYLDPPYGIKFGSNWQVSTRKRDVKDGKAEDATRQPEQVRAFRDTWKLGIHSYLAYLRDRLDGGPRAADRDRQHLRADRR